MKTNEIEPLTIPQTERRRVVVYLPEDTVLQIFNGGFILNDYIRLPQPLGLPATARVIGVWHDWNRRAFAMVIEDPSFLPVPAGVCLPEVKLDWVVREVRALFSITP